MLLSLKCRIYSEQGLKHAPCSGTTDDGTERPCGCWCHVRQPRGAISPAGYLRAVRGALAAVSTSLPVADDPDNPAPWEPDDYPFRLFTAFTVTGNAIRYTWAVGYPLETYGLSTACSGGELARASCGVPVRGCSPSPLSSSIRQG